MKRTRWKSTAGSAIPELALSVVLLWALLSGAFRVGYGIYVYESLVNQVASAARYASRVDFDPGHTFVSSVQKMAVYGSPNGGTAALVRDLTTANINVTWTTDSAGVPLTITVSIINYSVDAVFQTFSFSGKPAVTARFAGRYVT